MLREDEESGATDRDWGFPRDQVTRAFRDSLFSGVARRKQTGRRWGWEFSTPFQNCLALKENRRGESGRIPRRLSPLCPGKIRLTWGQSGASETGDTVELKECP